VRREAWAANESPGGGGRALAPGMFRTPELRGSKTAAVAGGLRV